MNAAATPVPVARLSGRRRALIWTLIVVASLIGLGSILTTWVDRQMLDEESWRTASAELIEDAQVREALSVYLVNQLYDNVDLAAGLEQRLPPDLKGLAAPLTGALRQPTTDAVERLLEAPRVQQLWINATSAAQQKLVNVLEDKTGAGISTGEGVVTVDLGELVTELGADLGVPASALARIPPDAGVITVMRSDQLAAAQTGVKVLRVLSVLLLVLVLAMYALAIYLAKGERRRTLRNVAWAFVLVGLVVLAVRRLAGAYTVEALTSPTSSDTGHDVWLISTSILGQIGWAAIIYGVIGVLGAVLAGPTSVGTAIRRWIAPVLNRRPGFVWAGAAVVYLLLIAWGPTHALRTAWGIALLGALVAGGILALRHQTLREFPAAEPGRAGPGDELDRDKDMALT
jgi:hypothetical protein